MRLIIIRKPDYTRGYIIDGTFYWLSPPEDHPLGEVVSNRHERRRQEAKPAMQPMLRTADDQDEGHMIVGSRFAVPDDCLALGLLGRKPHFCVGGVLYRGGPSAIRDTMAFCGRGMQDKWSMAVSLVKFGRTVRLHPRSLASPDPRAELFDWLGSDPLGSATADLRMDDATQRRDVAHRSGRPSA
jgi:hypothetical protein